jgi:uncharacterized protein YcbK (DUF882 family)
MRTSKAYIRVLFWTLAFLFFPASMLEPSTTTKSLFRLSGDGILSLEDVHTGESISVMYRDLDGIYDESALQRIELLLRSHGDGETFPISLKLLELVDHLQDHFGADEVKVNLRRHLRRVAHDSLHMQGMAMDIKLPDVGKLALGKYARSLAAGGVGVYRRSSFVHVDTGPVRSW